MGSAGRAGGNGIGRSRLTRDFRCRRERQAKLPQTAGGYHAAAGRDVLQKDGRNQDGAGRSPVKADVEEGGAFERSYAA